MIKALLSIWPLFLGLALIMAGNGLQGSLLGIRATLEGFNNFAIGFVISGYYWGFLIGSRMVPKMIENVGHVRVFGALSAIASTTILIHSMIPETIIWFIMRLLSGFAFSGIFIVSESWLNNASNNHNRGQMLSIYMIVTEGSLIFGQLLLGTANPMGFELFLLTSIIISIAAAPILITAAKVPDFEALESLSLIKMYRISPLAIIGIFIFGISNSMIFGMLAVWGTQSGMDNKMVALMMSSWTAGAVIFQWPIGKLSDIFDRRLIITISAFISSFLVILTGMVEKFDFYIFLIVIAIYGGFSLPIYSLCISYANDYLSPKQMTSAAGSLIFAMGLGMIAGPPLISLTTTVFGLNGFFPIIGLTHFILGVYALWRMTQRSALPQEGQGGHIPVPIKASAIAVSLSPEVESENNDQK